MNLLIIGNIASGKTSIAEELIKKEFATDLNYSSIDALRRGFSDGTYAGEFLAWSKMLSKIQNPPSNENAIFEFSGTGKNAWFVREAIKISKNQHKANWRIIYCSCDSQVLKERCKDRVYDVPIPYKFNNVESSIAFIGGELAERYNKNYWDSPEIVVTTDKMKPWACAETILNQIK
jgi:deoxyadenosine/deoxycytidine kinase